MGVDPSGERIKDHMRNIVPVLLDQNVSNFDKMRIIILYVISKNGLSEENLNKVVLNAGLLPEEKQAIVNLNLLGLNSVVNVNKLRLISTFFFYPPILSHLIFAVISVAGES